MVMVHGALILTQVMFGGGSVVGKLGVSSFNPMLFALIREAVAGIILFCWALYVDGTQHLKSKMDVLLFFLCGLFIFSNQAFFIIGDKLASPVIASAWQPTQPVFTLMISLLLGWERLTALKAMGIAISFGGAAFMVAYGTDFTSQGSLQLVMGNVFFFLNCLGTSLYVIMAKVMLRRGYPPSTVTAWSYLNGACLMACTATALNSSCPVVSVLLCPS